MAQRIGGNSGVFVPPAGVQTDTTLDQQRQQQIKQLQEHELVNNRDEAERVVSNVIQGLKSQVQSGTQAKQQQPTQTDLGRMIANFQREHGLPVTGRIDPATFGQLRDKGLTQPPSPPPSQPPGSPPPSQRGAAPPAPAGSAPPTSAPSTAPPSSAPSTQAAPPSTTTAPGPATSPAVRGADAGGAPPKTAPAPAQRAEDQAAARQARSAADQQMRARMDQGPSVSRSSAARDVSQATPMRDAFEAAPTNKADRVIDPSRLLASLLALGMGGKKGTLEDAIKALQASVGLPPTGKLDAKTMEELEKKGAVADVDARKTPASDKPVEKQQVRRALNEVTSRSAADRDVKRAPIRPQASTQKPTTSADVAARAPVSSTTETAAKEQTRLDSVLAQQDAFERGVQEGRGDPNAVAGHGQVQGEGQGVAGSGGQSGGGAPGVTGQGARAELRDADEVGEESAVGNAKAGDDDFTDDARGNANVDGDGDGAGGEGEHWSVPPLSEQVATALDRIARDDDGTGPVTYTWDVTFFRPGVYSAGQPAEEMWHVVVHQANAFDPVWQQAADAIASRMLYAEPDATPPTIEDFVVALRRARVR